MATKRTADDLPSIIPELKFIEWRYTIDANELPPKEDDFIVSIHNDKIIPISVHQVVTCRKTNSIQATAEGRARYALRLLKCPELLEHVTYVHSVGKAWVKGRSAFYAFKERPKKKS